MDLEASLSTEHWVLTHVNTASTIFSINKDLCRKAATYNLTTLCLNGTLSCVDFMDVIMGDIPLSVILTVE